MVKITDFISWLSRWTLIYYLIVKGTKLWLSVFSDCQGEWARLTPDKPRWLKFDVDSVELTDEETIATRKLEDARRRLEADHGPLPRDTKIKSVRIC